MTLGVVAPYEEPLGERLLTPGEVAEFLGIEKDAVLDLASGRGGRRPLPKVRINARVVRFRPSDVREWVDAQREVAQPRLSDELPRKKTPSPARRMRRVG